MVSMTCTRPFSDSGVVVVPTSVDRACVDTDRGRAAGSSAVEVVPQLAGATGATVEARLDGPAGADWDLAVFDRSGNVVAAAAGPDATEVASGYVPEPGPLTVQACRIGGAGTTAEISVVTEAVEDTGGGK